MAHHMQPRTRLFRLTAVAGAMMAIGGMSQAAEVDTGNPDLKMRWDNTVRYNLGMRVEDQDSRILRSNSYDESDAKFGKNDIVMNRLDLLSEVDLNFKGQVGARVSASGWYDQAYKDTSVTAPNGAATSYFNNEYNNKVKRYVTGPSGEFLDAFVWGNFDLGNAPTNIKLGRHTVVWGEGLFIGAHAISYSQAPVDGQKAVGSPGIETKEVFLPLNQISAKIQATNDLTIAGQYFLEWKETRAPNGGTYLMGADTAPNVDRLALGGPTLAATNIEAVKPKQRGNWGLSARLNVDAINSTVGAYYREFDDYNPENGIQFRSFTGPLPTTFRFVYPQKTKLIGLSLARAIGPFSVGSEISLRKNASLNTVGSYASTPALADQGTGARGDTLHAIVNGVMLLPKTALWDTGSFAGEIAYSHLQKVTTNSQLYKGVGTAACTKTAGTGTGPGDESDACSSKNFYQIAFSLAPQYLGIFPSVDLAVPISVNYGVKGVAPSASGGFEKLLSWSIGTNFTYNGKYEFSLRYADISAPSKYNTTTGALAGGGASGGSLGATDRGWLAATFRTSF